MSYYEISRNENNDINDLNNTNDFNGYYEKFKTHFLKLTKINQKIKINKKVFKWRTFKSEF